MNGSSFMGEDLLGSLDFVASLPGWVFLVLAALVGLAIWSGSLRVVAATVLVALVGLWSSTAAALPASAAQAAIALMATAMVAGFGVVASANRRELLRLQAQAAALEAKVINLEALLQGQVLRGPPQRYGPEPHPEAARLQASRSS